MRANVTQIPTISRGYYERARYATFPGVAMCYPPVSARNLTKIWGRRDIALLRLLAVAVLPSCRG